MAKKIIIPDINDDRSRDSNTEYIDNNYGSNFIGQHQNNATDGLMYSARDSDQITVDISMSKLFNGIRNEIPEDPIKIQSIGEGREVLYEKNITRQSVGLGIGQKIARGLGVNEIPPPELVDLSGSETINWIELSLYQIILQMISIDNFLNHRIRYCL